MKKHVHLYLSCISIISTHAPLQALTKKQAYMASVAAGSAFAGLGLYSALNRGHTLGGTELAGTARMAAVGSLLSYLFFRRLLNQNDFERTWKPAYLALKKQYISFFTPQDRGGFAFDWQVNNGLSFKDNIKKEYDAQTIITYNPGSWYSWLKSFVVKPVSPKELQRKKVKEAKALYTALEEKLKALNAMNEKFKNKAASNSQKINFESVYYGFQKELSDKITELSKNKEYKLGSSDVSAPPSVSQPNPGMQAAVFAPGMPPSVDASPQQEDKK